MPSTASSVLTSSSWLRLHLEVGDPRAGRAGREPADVSATAGARASERGDGAVAGGALEAEQRRAASSLPPGASLTAAGASVASAATSSTDPSATRSRIGQPSPTRDRGSRAGDAPHDAVPAHVDLPRVVGVERPRIAADAAGVAQHRRDVVRRLVVVEERAPVGARRAVGVQVVGGAEDRVARVADVPAEAVGRPANLLQLFARRFVAPAGALLS